MQISSWVGTLASLSPALCVQLLVFLLIRTTVIQLSKPDLPMDRCRLIIGFTAGGIALLIICAALSAFGVIG